MHVVEEKKPDHGEFPQMGTPGFPGGGSSKRVLLFRRGGYVPGCRRKDPTTFSLPGVTPNARASIRCRVACPLTWVKCGAKGIPWARSGRGGLELDSGDDHENENEKKRPFRGE